MFFLLLSFECLQSSFKLVYAFHCFYGRLKTLRAYFLYSHNTCLHFWSSYLTAWIIKRFASYMLCTLYMRNWYGELYFTWTKSFIKRVKTNGICHAPFDFFFFLLFRFLLFASTIPMWQWNINIGYKYTHTPPRTSTSYICSYYSFVVL